MDEDIQTTHKLFKQEYKSFVYRIFINDFENSDNLDDIFNELLNATENDYLELRIASNGGYISELQRFHNIIENYFPERCSTVLDNYGYSAGALIFLLGNERIVHESSQIMFHDFSGSYFGKSSDMFERMDFDKKLYKEYFKKLIQLYFSKQEIEQFFNGKEYWFDCEEMCKRGIATHVISKGVQYTAKDYLAQKQPKQTKNTKTIQTKQSKQPETKNESNTESKSNTNRKTTKKSK